MKDAFVSEEKVYTYCLHLSFQLGKLVKKRVCRDDSHYPVQKYEESYPTDDNVENFMIFENRQQSQDVPDNKPLVYVENNDFELFLRKIGLYKFYPGKLQISDVMKTKSIETHRDLKDIAFVFVKHLVTLNISCRDKILEEYIYNLKLLKHDSLVSCDFFEKILEYHTNSASDIMNPLDLILAVFKCSSPRTKQILASKLFMCQLAIPLCFPAVLDDKIEVSMWPLRSIVIERQTEDGSFQNIIAVDSPCQVVSFIRFGRPTFSKSNLINTIIADQDCNTFLNKNCPLGTTKRNFTEGLIEVAWFFSSDKCAQFGKQCAFINIRGDCRIFREQLKLVSKISSVVVISMKSKHLDNIDYQQLTITLHQEETGVILAIDANKDSNTSVNQKLHTFFDKNVQLKKTTRCIIFSNDGQDTTTSQIVSEMQYGIGKLIRDKKNLSLSERLHRSGAKIDEEKECYMETKQMAEKIIKSIPKINVHSKNKILPLQGQFMRTWSEKNKCIQKLKDETQDNHEFVLQEMNKIRLNQVHMCEDLNPFIQLFLNSLTKLLPFQKCEIFMLWLNQFFDERSRKILPAYFSEYQYDLQLLKSAEGLKNCFVMNGLRDQLDKSETHLFEASFGLEHLCREIGQVYEALCTCKETHETFDKLKQQLPRMTAELIKLGMPFEIMDGDAAYIPISWVKAVLTNLKDIIGDKKLLVLSVLGVRCSGKSTLLNSMFGFQFPVTGGRFTRGTFMQLGPVDEHRYPFDFVLAIDTEGISNPQLAHEKHSHDNAISTFVIGLSDITILTFKGTNAEEVKNVLQGSIHALLRLKLANIRLNTKPSCVFVHQNIKANNTNAEIRSKLIRDLDALTKEVADLEEIANIHCFNDVIQLDVANNVWFLGGLWCGTSSMHPANRGYSQSVTNIRNAIFDLIAKREKNLTLTDTIAQIEHLWNEILKDGFVFRYRNSLDTKAYNNMEKKSRAFTLDLEQIVSESIRFDAYKDLMECNTMKELDKKSCAIIKMLSTLIDETVTSIINRLNTLIEVNIDKEVMIQWKNSKRKRFRMTAEYLKAKSGPKINVLTEVIRLYKRRKNEQIRNEKVINCEVKQLATNMRKNTEITETILKKIFEDEWKIWVDKFATIYFRDFVSFEETKELELYQKFQPDIDEVVLKETGTFSKQYYENMSKLEDSFPIEWISKDDFKIHRSLILKKDNTDNCIRQTENITNQIFRKIDKKLVQFIEHDKIFKTSHVFEILDLLVNDISEHQNLTGEEYKFSFLLPFRKKMVAHIVRYSLALLSRLNTKKREHNTKEKIQAYKDTAWLLFRNLVQNKNEDVIALGFFREALLMKVIEHVSVVLPSDAQCHIEKFFQYGKLSIIKRLMIHIAKTEDFADFKSFIDNPKSFGEKFIFRLISNTLFAEMSNGINNFTELVRFRIHNMFLQISKSIAHADQETETNFVISIWLKHFVNHSNDSNGIPLSNGTFVHVVDGHSIDLQHFLIMLKQELRGMEDYVLEYFREKATHNSEWKTGIVLSIIDNLWGCTEVCMFCREPCIHADRNHINNGDPHRFLQHRPQGVIGIISKETGRLENNFCNQSLNTDNTYDNIRGKTGKFKEYKHNFPDWDIFPNSVVSKYWMWIFVKFQNQLQGIHNAELPMLPVYWTTISKSDAIGSLNK